MEELNPSESCELGKKEYWEEFYSIELENFGDSGDTGEIWFGKKNLERIVNWLCKNEVDKDLPILDVGCGNAMTLVSLAKAGYTDLTGVDYAQEAIDLSKKIVEQKNLNITLETLDFLGANLDSSSALYSKKFHIVIDKGTYDAICLDRQNAALKRKKYIEQVLRILSSAGFFLLFSCNWTKDELLQHFDAFSIHDEIDIPSISFGGKSGQTVTALVLKKCVL
ncbi:hypothetical protein JTE90_029008 [Oedothorax gibbosus]|uniref:Protein-lysine N-methyltransferase JTE90_029008 n=1 Tax=Oedothorax gibbosus TaxID=931172 RepID=A0AAV6VH82_9ARAC|nr:hypothetical protein JTE90_029008 [Oedothorax gibbosus]